MRSIIFFIFFLLSCSKISAQLLELKWATRIGGSNASYMRNMTADNSGSTYTLVSFSGTADFDPGPTVVNITAIGSYDFALVKQNFNGNLIWARHFGGAGFEGGYGVTLDNSGNIFICATFNNTVDFDPGGAVNNLTATSSYDIAVIKLDVNGNFVWVKQIKGNGNTSAKSIDTDNAGNIIIHGDFTGTYDFDPDAGIVNLTSAGSDLYILKLNPSGNIIWVQSFGSTGSEGARSIAIDSNNDIVCTSLFSGTVDFDPGPGTYNLTSTNIFDVVIFKINNSGNFVWATLITGNTWEQVEGITVDAANNVWVTGYFYDICDFDGGPGVYSMNSGSPSYANTYILKLSPAGNFLMAKQLAGNAENLGNGIVTDNAGNIYVTGAFKGTIDFDPGPGVQNVTCVGNQGWYVVKLNSAGNYVWGGGSGGDYFSNGYSIAMDGTNNLYVAGTFYSSIDFDPDPVLTSFLTSSAICDIFVARFGPSTLPVEFLHFTGQEDDDKVKLHWSTASEINNDYFTIERSVDADNFSFCGTVSGSGSTSLQSDYTFTDHSAPQGLIYYRLLQTDYDGHSETLSTIAVKNENQRKQIVVSNDPVSGLITVYGMNVTNGNSLLTISELSGKIIFSDEINSEKMTYGYNLKTNYFVQGLYILTVKNQSTAISQPVLLNIKN